MVLEDLRDEGHVSDLYDLSFLKAFFVFAIGRWRLVVSGGKAKRVERMSPEGHCLLLCPLRACRILILEVAVRIITVILGTLAVIEGF